VAPYLGGDIAVVVWADVEPFANLVAEIKPLSSPSPVFTSKFCHFLAPRLFPVVDNEAMHNRFRTYEECFATYQAEWLGTNAAMQGQLEEVLTREIGAPLCDGYPLKCKLIELCLTGRCRLVKTVPSTAG
jgi:hypothetical protein